MRSRIALSAGFAGLAAAALTVAGPLNPPAGPVAPTMKTLTDIEPRTLVSAASTPGDSANPPSVYTISQPGSYYLAANFQVPADKGRDQDHLQRRDARPERPHHHQRPGRIREDR